jgi:hypothetical protein
MWPEFLILQIDAIPRLPRGPSFPLGKVELHSSADKVFERRFVDFGFLVNVDGASDISVETRIEETVGSLREAPLKNVSFTTFL